MSVIDEIKDRLDIVEVLSGYVSLKKAGRNFKGLCPFHAEKTSSFVVFPESGTWHCFGACGTGGDIFAFIMRRENMDFSEALRFLAQRAGVELPSRSEAQQAEDKRLARLREINAAAATYYHHLLLTSGGGEEARTYLEKRAVERETIERFQLGYAPPDWQELGHHLLNKGYRQEEVRDAGLIIEKEDGSGWYDRFRHRLMIPIRDVRGRAVGFGGRVLGEGQPKYLNSPQTSLFDKGRTLFGLDLAKGAIQAENTAVVAEGYMDVIQAHQHGLTNVVASMGTALTEDQVKLLKRFAARIVLALDADAAGKEAIQRGLELSRQLTLHEVIKIGPVLTEKQYSGEADVRIAVLPGGKDPDQVIREDLASWRQIIEGALPVIDYYFQLVTADLDLASPQGKSIAVQRLLPIIRDIEDKIQQAHYLQKLARLVKVEEKVLWEKLAPEKRRRVGQVSEWQTTRALDLESPAFGPEEYCLAWLLRRPHLLTMVDALLIGVGVEPLAESSFRVTENRQIFSALRERIAAEGQELDLDEFRAGLTRPLPERIDFLLEQLEASPPLSEEKVEKDVADSALRLCERNLQERIRELHFLFDDARAQNLDEAVERYETMVDACWSELWQIQQARLSDSTQTIVWLKMLRGQLE